MRIERSRDGTVKLNFAGGYSAVIIPIGGRNTLCVSSQVGCAMGCAFCFSGRRKFERNLSLEELKGQLDVALEYLGIGDKVRGEGDFVLADKISGIVFMGMGEPMANLANVFAFCDFVNEEYSYAYSRILISTSGIIPGIERVIEKYSNKIQLAVSLHSPFQEIRDKIMPGLKNFALKDLVAVIHRYNEVYRQKIMIEYVMIDGVNDREEDLVALLEMGFSERTLFNLIRFNEGAGNKVEGIGELKPSSDERVEYFREKLMGAGYKCFTRQSMGVDISAACGMLK